jgi:hypothetical protein
MARGNPGPRGPQHSEDFRRVAADSLWNQLLAHEKALVSTGGKIKFGRGPSGDRRVTAALEQMQAHYTAEHPCAREVAALNRHSFLKLAKAWLPKIISDSPRCVNKRRKVTSALENKEWMQAALILGEPSVKGGDVHVFRSVQDCMEFPHAGRKHLHALVEKSGLPVERFERELKQQCPDLHYKPIDKVPQLTKETRAARQQASDIWAGRAPWRDFRSSKRACVGGKRQRLTATARGAMWDTDWYKKFVMMLDAAKVDNQQSAADVKEYGFGWKGVVLPPEEHRAGKSMGQATSLMFYAVIHGRHGKIVGPDLMYWGSNKTTRASVADRHGGDFPHWCVAGKCIRVRLALWRRPSCETNAQRCPSLSPSPDAVV